MAHSSRSEKLKMASFTARLMGLFLLLCLAGWASQGSSITGTVVDPSGAVIAGASVTISSPENGLSKIAATNSEGVFSFSEVPPGRYQVEIRSPGFRPLLESGLTVEAGQALSLDLKMELDQQATTVAVTESSLHVETTDTSTGDTITAAKMSTIPLNGRSFTDLLAIQPGVTPVSSRQPNAVDMSGCTSTSPSGDLNPGNLSINGQRETSNGFILNGSEQSVQAGAGQPS